MDDTAIVKAEDAAAAPVTAAPKRSHHAKLARPGNTNARKHGLDTMRTALKVPWAAALSISAPAPAGPGGVAQGADRRPWRPRQRLGSAAHADRDSR